MVRGFVVQSPIAAALAVAQRVGAAAVAQVGRERCHSVLSVPLASFEHVPATCVDERSATENLAPHAVAACQSKLMVACT